MSEEVGDRVARWDERYAGREYVWDVGPNIFVERYLSGIEPGTAVDLGAGEGRNAVWLAEQGWRVAAVDFSRVGLEKAVRLAEHRGVADRVETILADAPTFQPPEPVDLVVVAYLQLPAEQRRIALEHAATWLRPGGRVFVVAHDRSNVERGYGGPPVEDVCYDLDETVTALAGLTVDVAQVVERQVEAEEGLRTALDTLVIAARSAG